MRSNNLLPLLCVAVLVTGCGGGSTSNDTPSGSGAANVMTITVNGSLCSESTSSAYPNKACVSVTVCSPGTSTCQTVNDILLDTGSNGLRIFSSVLGGVTLNQVASDGGGALAECARFGDGSKLWGPVRIADVVMGGEPAVQLPVQLIDSSYFPARGVCSGADASPSAAGFNGILGVGLFRYDCGTACRDGNGNGMYYSCSGASCTASAALLASQVQNPVALLPLDNNGVIVKLPAVASGGAASLNGSLILGIGTRSNNVPASGVVAYPTDQYAEFSTTIDFVTYNTSFLDTGSNGLFFPSTTLPDCSSVYSSWYCPPATTTLTATTAGYAGTPSTVVPFDIGNAISLFSGSNRVFSELGGSVSFAFDWGLPFFMGRTVYVGIDSTSSSLGTGPYWAY